MKKLILLPVALTLMVAQANGTIDSLINSGKSINKAKILYDSGKYELAATELSRIDPRDTNYLYAMSEKASALLEIPRYQEAIDICTQALKRRSGYRASFYHSMAYAYSRIGKTEQALSTLKEGLAEFPFSYFLQYRYGTILYHDSKFDEAERWFFKILESTPYHSSSHLYLSKIAMRRGNKIEGMLSMGLYLTLKNSDNTQLQVLENFVKNELTDEGEIPKAETANPFSRADEIIRSKISFDDEFKIKIPIDVGIVRQYQVLFELLETQSFVGDSPWIKYYIKIYKELIRANAQEAFIYHILQSGPIESAQQWKKKNDKSMQQFYT
ncbi:MAG TPA: tetratricopeptide repeat protein, partial [Cyclobacteriaceae bacterium]|nr:tetratricopeptide repeat protein [Cyclobacteriaceae bacterium]